VRVLYERLAELLATPDGLRTFRLLQSAGMLQEPLSPALSHKGERENNISIWEKQGDVWVRPDPLPLGDHYATRKVLAKKEAELPLRVVLFGESVAAGYLYAPHITPAQILEGYLQAAGGPENFEVIDLSRTNETLPGLAATVRASLQIQPDMLVLFVGNNWNLLETPEISPYAPSVQARQRYAQALREGIEGPVRLAEEELRKVAEGTFELIALIAGTVKIPVIVVIPEVNLADWETRQPVVRLPGDGVARWHALYREAVEGKWEAQAMIRAAKGMQRLDGGTCPTSWRLLGMARLGLGDREGALQAFQAEIDCARYATLGFLSAPQATTQARELLRELSRKHGFTCVDLREIFASWTEHPLPGRRLFLDYCHLTLEGIQVAMAAVATEALWLSGMSDTEEDEDWRSFLHGELSLPAPAEIEATALLGAAVHSAHRLLTTLRPKQEILEGWCEEALELCPEIEQAMLDLLEARCAPVPAVLTAAQQRNLSSPFRLLLQHGWRWDYLDADLLQAMAAALERTGRPFPLPTTPKGADLEPWEPLERFFPEVMDLEDLPRRGTWRSPWPVSSFCLVADGTEDVGLELTARLPEGGQGEIEAAVNGVRVGVFPVGERWTKESLRVPASALRAGLNRLTLRWPDPPPVEGDPFRTVLERLDLGLEADLHPVFGEVFSLVREGS
jgi:phenylpyruvate tautomerase PptA (4-oxalocrotonate tautomerase family)